MSRFSIAEHVSRYMWHNLSSNHQQLENPPMLVLLDQTNHPLLCLCLSLPLSSQLSSRAYGLTIFVNIYFCVMDMKSLMSLLLQRLDWNLPVGRGESRGHLRAAEMLINKDLWTRNWISNTSTEQLALCSHRAVLSYALQKRNQNETRSAITLKGAACKNMARVQSSCQLLLTLLFAVCLAVAIATVSTTADWSPPGGVTVGIGVQLNQAPQPPQRTRLDTRLGLDTASSPKIQTTNYTKVLQIQKKKTMDEFPATQGHFCCNNAIMRAVNTRKLDSSLISHCHKHISL